MCIGECGARSDYTHVHLRVWSKIRLHVCASDSMEQDQTARMYIGECGARSDYMYVCQSMEQDQTAHIYRLILNYTLLKFSPWLRTAG